MSTRLLALLLATVACATVACAAAPAALPTSALAHPPRRGDAASTRAYVRANYALVRAARANLRAGEAALRSLTQRITGECPLAAAESPQNRESEQLSIEVVGAMTLVAYRPDAHAIAVFARAVRGLHWSSRGLTRIVQTYATQLEGLAKLALPDVCADVRAWAASGYRTLPASTVQFDRVYNADDIEAEEVRPRLLAPYESARDAVLLRRTKRLEAPLAEAEARAVSDYTKILDGLQLSQ